MRYTTDEARVCCGRTVFRKGRIVELTDKADVLAAEKHPDIREAVEAPEAPEAEEAPEGHTPSALQAMNKFDLAEIAASVDADTDTTDTKADMIAAILEAQG